MAKSETPPPARKRVGRPSLGPRVGIHIWLPHEFYKDVSAMAAQDNLALGRIITRLVAQALDKEPPPWSLPQKASNQEELPLADAS